jgi:hypothetical protein
VKLIALVGFLLFDSTATAGELCVNYVAGIHIERLHSAPWWSQDCDGGKCAFTSFNPRTRTSLVVAKIDGVSVGIVWETGFGALVYNGMYRLEWKLGAVPAPLTPESRLGPYPNASRSQQPGTLWNDSLWDANTPSASYDANASRLTFDAPAHRKIEAGDASGIGEISGPLEVSAPCPTPFARV